MSVWIKCDRCDKITEADNSGAKRYKIGVDGFDGYSTYHLCEGCLREFYSEFMEWAWDNNEYQYKPLVRRPIC